MTNSEEVRDAPEAAIRPPSLQYLKRSPRRITRMTILTRKKAPLEDGKE